MSEAPKRKQSNLAALAISRVVLAVSGLLVMVAVRRVLGEGEFGLYRWVGSVIAIATTASNLGLQFLIAREVARKPNNSAMMLPVALQTVGGLSAIAGVAVMGAVALLDGRAEVVAASGFAAVAMGMSSGSLIVQSVFHGLRRFSLELPGVVIGALLLLASQVGLLAMGYGLAPLYAGRAVAMGVGFAVLWWTWHSKARLPTPPGVVQIGRRGLIKASLAFAATGLMGAIYAQADILMLQALRSDVEVGRYAAPAIVLLQLAMVANMVSRAVYPKMALHLNKPDMVSDELRFLARMLLLISLPVAVGGMVTAAPLMRFLFGSDAAGSVLPFLWLLPAVPLRFLNNGYGLSLAALNGEKQRSQIDFMGAVINVASNLVAIPMFGAVGAAMTTLGTDLCINLALRWRLKAVAPQFGVFGPFVGALIPALVMGGAVWLASPLHVVLRIGLGVCVYAAVGWFAGSWSRSDLGRLRRI